MKHLLLICLFLCVMASCKKSLEISNCIQNRINTFALQGICQNSAAVREYYFQSKLVYVFDGGNCIADGDAKVFDADCNYLGYLGGFPGNTKINGVEFSVNAQFKRVIWHN